MKEEPDQYDSNGVTAANARWPPVTQVWGTAGKILPVLQQSKIIQEVLRGGIDRVLFSIAFIQAFPSRIECDVATHNSMVAAAREQGQEEIAERLEQDAIYSRDFCKVVSHIITLILTF